MLAPLSIIWRDPKGLGSADSAGAGRCDDGCEYVFKDDSRHPLTPHNEWFCTHLAGVVGIACPPCAVIQDEHKQAIFGSRWEGGIAKDKWREMVASGDVELDAIAPTLSKILVFDHFVYNDDRHLNNYLFREARNGWVMLAFDFSRAWTFHGFPPSQLPFLTNQKTRCVYQFLKRKFGDFLVYSEVASTLDRLASVDVAHIQDIIYRHPESWLTIATKDATLNWWSSDKRLDRIELIRKGIGDGSYL